MLRRNFLKRASLFLAASALIFMNPLKAVAEIVRRRPISSVGEALQLNNSIEMTKFVLAQPLKAQTASLQEKLGMLKLIVFTCNRQGALEQANREKASFLILQNEEGKAANLKYLADGVGRQWIGSNIGSWKNADLKRVVTKALST
jgi:hypothetical protein